MVTGPWNSSGGGDVRKRPALTSESGCVNDGGVPDTVISGRGVTDPVTFEPPPSHEGLATEVPVTFPLRSH